MSLVLLGTYWDPFEAEIVRGRLQADGIETVLFDTGLGGAYGNAFPVRLMVLDEDLPAARAILAENSAD